MLLQKNRILVPFPALIWRKPTSNAKSAGLKLVL
jgi:hypothetical protein